MSGTSRRGRWYEEDLAQSQWLRHSKKNKHENNIIVKAMKKELETIADKGHVQVIDQHAIEKYPTVYQMTTTLMTERSEEHTSELQSRFDLVCRLLLEKKKK